MAEAELPLIAVVPRCYISGKGGRHRLIFAEAEPRLPGAGAGGDRAHLAGEPAAEPGGPHSAHEGYGYSLTEQSLRKYGLWGRRDELAVAEPAWFYLGDRWGSASHNVTKTFTCRTAAGTPSTGHVREEGLHGNVRPAASTAAGGASVEELARLPAPALLRRFKNARPTARADGLSPEQLAGAVAESAAVALRAALAAAGDGDGATLRSLLLRPQMTVAKRHDHMCEEQSTTAKAKAPGGAKRRGPPGYVLARVTAIDDSGGRAVATEIWVDGRRYRLATTQRQRDLGMSFN